MVKEMDLDRIRNLIIGFVLVALIAAAGALALYEFQTNERPKDTTSETNETVTLSSITSPSTATVSRNTLFISHSDIRNESSQDLDGFCNMSSDGDLSCNATGSLTCYVDYSHYTWTYLMNITNNGLAGVDNTTVISELQELSQGLLCY